MSLTKILVANNAGTTLQANLALGATTLLLSTGSGYLFPNPNNSLGEFFAITISDALFTIWEIVYCTARSGDVCTIIRSQEGTSDQAWSTGDIAANLLTAGSFEYLSQISGTVPISSGGTGLSTLGSANQFLAVNSGGTALNYITVTPYTPPSVLPVANGGTGLSSLGSANQILAVNSGGTALHYVNNPNLIVINSPVVTVDHGVTTSPTVAVGYTEITTGGTSNAINLPTAIAGQICILMNRKGADCEVYPQPGGSIFGGIYSAAPVGLGGAEQSSIQILCKGGDDWVYFSDNYGI
jgi:hypothetical protein